MNSKIRKQKGKSILEKYKILSGKWVKKEDKDQESLIRNFWAEDKKHPLVDEKHAYFIEKAACKQLSRMVHFRAALDSERAPQEAGVVLVSAPLFKRLASIHSLKHYSELGFPVGQWELNSVPITSTAAVIAAALS